LARELKGSRILSNNKGCSFLNTCFLNVSSHIYYDMQLKFSFRRNMIMVGVKKAGNVLLVHSSIDRREIYNGE
jgi:hypothetical protein